MATPFVVRQIQSEGQAMAKRRGPSIHPTSGILRARLLLGRFPEFLVVNRIAGTDLLVACLPVPLLAFLGLDINTRAWEKEVQPGRSGILCVWETNTVEDEPEATSPVV